MTKDEIISMARVAFACNFCALPVSESRIEHFAALVAAAEREACARVAEDWDTDSADPRDVATAIRARSQQ